MIAKIAAVSALLVFMTCLTLGWMAENTLATILARSLIAMGATYLIGLVIGAMAAKMMSEHRGLESGDNAESAGMAAETSGGAASGVRNGDAAAIVSRQSGEKIKNQRTKTGSTADKQK